MPQTSSPAGQGIGKQSQWHASGGSHSSSRAAAAGEPVRHGCRVTPGPARATGRRRRPPAFQVQVATACHFLIFTSNVMAAATRTSSSSHRRCCCRRWCEGRGLRVARKRAAAVGSEAAGGGSGHGRGRRSARRANQTLAQSLTCCPGTPRPCWEPGARRDRLLASRAARDWPRHPAGMQTVGGDCGQCGGDERQPLAHFGGQVGPSRPSCSHRRSCSLRSLSSRSLYSVSSPSIALAPRRALQVRPAACLNSPGGACMQMRPRCGVPEPGCAPPLHPRSSVAAAAGGGGGSCCRRVDPLSCPTPRPFFSLQP